MFETVEAHHEALLLPFQSMWSGSYFQWALWDNTITVAMVML
jgi:hypothetical protein